MCHEAQIILEIPFTRRQGSLYSLPRKRSSGSEVLRGLSHTGFIILGGLRSLLLHPHLTCTKLAQNLALGSRVTHFDLLNVKIYYFDKRFLFFFFSQVKTRNRFERDIRTYYLNEVMNREKRGHRDIAKQTIPVHELATHDLY